MKQVKILTYQYLEVIIKFQEPEIFYEKDAVLFHFFIL